MSLMSHLADQRSPVRQFFAHHLHADSLRACVIALNVAATQNRRRVPLVIPGTVPTLAGTAFDFGFRHFIEPFTPAQPPNLALSGGHQARSVGWKNALPILHALLTTLADADATGQAQRFVALAAYEQFARVLPFIVNPKAATSDDFPRSLYAHPPTTLNELLARTPEATVEDVAALLAMAHAEWAWLRGQPFVPNPTFPLSATLGGADADWVLGGTLYECKASTQDRPLERKHMLQLLGYLLLDTEDALGITRVGFVLPRQRAIIQRSVIALLQDLGATDDLPDLLARFAAVVGALPRAT
jgi:hypothetical protein